VSPPAGPPPADLPSTIGRYRIRSRVSSDPRDDVYVAFDPLIERPVAIKVYRLRTTEPAAVERAKQAFFNEMRRTGALIHPNIVTLFDAGELPGALFTASELVEGASLADRLDATAALDLPMRVSMIMQIVEALEYARQHGAPHLGLKPVHVHIATDFTIKIGGFGVAAVLDAIAAASEDGLRWVSRYTAPERASGQPGDARADVYSLAQIALEVLAGRGATSGDPNAGWSAERLPLLPPALADQGVSAERWASVFARALAPDPARRYDSTLMLKFELVLLLGVDETDAQASWDMARALGQLAPLAPTPEPEDDSVATMLAEARARLAAAPRTLGLPADEPDTGVETVLGPSGEGTASTVTPQPAPAEAETMLTPQPWRRQAAGSDEPTKRTSGPSGDTTKGG
jgi:serine/threonine-protein kinase